MSQESFDHKSVEQIVNGAGNESIAADYFESCHASFRHWNEKINAFREADFGSANDYATGKALSGVPVGVKDGICTKRFKTCASSQMLQDFQSPYNATVIERLIDAGAVPVGKTNMDEFAMGSSNENSSFGVTRNPWDFDRVPGGSSGGSAAAVAAGMVPLALGSDTGGSIRQPAAFCGITGLKPTYGLVSRMGLIAFASSLDQIGPMGKSAADAAAMLQVIAGHDPKDSTSAKVEVPDYVNHLSDSIDGLRVGVCRAQWVDGVDKSIVDAVEVALKELENQGAKIVEIELPHDRYSVATYYVVATCEASSNLSRYDGIRYTTRSQADSLHDVYAKTRSEYFGAEVKRRILLGTFALSSGYYDQYYVKASKVRRLIKQDYETAFQNVDVIAGPTTPTTAFRIGEQINDPLQMYLADVFTVSANLAGFPAISIPCGFSSGLPIGLHLQGAAFDEARLLNVAHQFQQQTDWHLRRPAR